MRVTEVGEICLLTRDVIRLAGFYRELLGLEGENADPVHQFLIREGTALTVMQDEGERSGQSAALAFTVEDIEVACARVKELGGEVAEPPTKRPWGAINMSFRDPDGNLVYFRQLG